MQGLGGSLGKRTLTIAVLTASVSSIYFWSGWLEAAFDIEAFGEHHMSRLHLEMPVEIVQFLVPTLLFTVIAVTWSLAAAALRPRRRTDPTREREQEGQGLLALGPFASGAYIGALVAALLGGLAMYVEGVPIGVFGLAEKLISYAGWLANDLIFEPLAISATGKLSPAWDALALARVYAAAGVSWVSWGLIGSISARIRRGSVGPT